VSWDWREHYQVTPVPGSGIGDADQLRRVVKYADALAMTPEATARMSIKAVMDRVVQLLWWPVCPEEHDARVIYAREAIESVRAWAGSR
jgi:hypothetical protein